MRYQCILSATIVAVENQGNFLYTQNMIDKYEYKPESAETYKDLGIQDTSYEMAFSEARRMFGDIKGKDFLDFGSGTGRSSRFLKRLGAQRIVGADHNQNMVAQAQAAAEEGLEYKLIAGQIPEADNSFDGAFSGSAFVETKTLNIIQSALAEIARVVKPGGVFVLATANPEAFGHDFKNYSRTENPENLRSGQVTKCTIKRKKPFVIEDVYWTEQDYISALESAGFAVEEITFPKATTEGDWLDETEVAPEMVIKA